jgi:hypothetical protein
MTAVRHVRWLYCTACDVTWRRRTLKRSCWSCGSAAGVVDRGQPAVMPSTPPNVLLCRP